MAKNIPIHKKNDKQLFVNYRAIAKGIGILVRARQLLYGESLMTIYNALIKPNFMYCITAWGNTYKTNYKPGSI